MNKFDAGVWDEKLACIKTKTIGFHVLSTLFWHPPRPRYNKYHAPSRNVFAVAKEKIANRATAFARRGNISTSFTVKHLGGAVVRCPVVKASSRDGSDTAHFFIAGGE